MGGQIGPLSWTWFEACDILPSTICEEPVIAAGNQFRSVLECNAIGGFDCRPAVDPVRDHVAAKPAFADSTVDCVSDLDLRQGLRSPVGHQDRSVTRRAVIAGVGAPSIDIDRTLEVHAAGGGDAVEDRLRLDLVELDAPELRGVEGAQRRGRVEQGEVSSALLAAEVAEGEHASA